jgi:D-methionine transport system ATP-binding protein
VLSATTIRFGVSVDILHGKIEYIGNRAMGLLVVRFADLPVDAAAPPPATSTQSVAARITAAVQFIRDNASQVEVLHAH